MLSTNAANEYKYTQYKNTQPFFNHYTGQPVLSRYSQLRTGGFCWSKVLLPHALADGN